MRGSYFKKIFVWHNCLYREVTDSEISSLFSCGSDLQGDLVSWSQEEWSQFGDVAIETLEYQKLCESKFENHLVAVPEPVTFHEASFICDFLSGRIFSVHDDLYDADGLYQKLKSELDSEFLQMIGQSGLLFCKNMSYFILFLVISGTPSLKLLKICTTLLLYYCNFTYATIL